MPYQATVYDVMIASPGDVATERQIAREVVFEWNRAHGGTSGIVLNPVGWETHSSPEMGQRPQEVINRQILAQSDLLIAMFWTRLGTPTGKASSGTVEEIQEHLKAGKPALLYFSSSPVQPASVDPEQFAALRAFRTECMKHGIVESYESIAEFRKKLARQLAQTVVRSFAGAISQSEPPHQPTPAKGTIALSAEAKQLLENVSRDAQGRLMKIGTLQGLIVQTNGRNFTEIGNARSEVKWESAIQELVDLALLQDRSSRGEVFSLTNEGYRVADNLRLEE